jgi:hypothetical protein
MMPYPWYDDPTFLKEAQKLIQQLGERYDGNPTLAYVRIATSKDCEDKA